eukprot:4017879-Pleurochrysis_carterae.AAC.1
MAIDAHPRLTFPDALSYTSFSAACHHPFWLLLRTVNSYSAILVSINYSVRFMLSLTKRANSMKLKRFRSTWGRIPGIWAVALGADGQAVGWTVAIATAEQGRGLLLLCDLRLYYGSLHPELELCCSRGVANLCGAGVAPAWQVKVVVVEETQSFASFVTKICAVIGGIYTVVGLLDNIIYHGGQAAAKKLG